MSRVEYSSLGTNEEVLLRAAEERPEYTDSWMEEVQEIQ